VGLGTTASGATSPFALVLGRSQIHPRQTFEASLSKVGCGAQPEAAYLDMGFRSAPIADLGTSDRRPSLMRMAPLDECHAQSRRLLSGQRLGMPHFDTAGS
jgi:hypothetical protein